MVCALETFIYMLSNGELCLVHVRGGGECLSDWEYCLSFSRFFILFSVLVSALSALARDVWHGAFV